MWTNRPLIIQEVPTSRSVWFGSGATCSLGAAILMSLLFFFFPRLKRESESVTFPPPPFCVVMEEGGQGERCKEERGDTYDIMIKMDLLWNSEPLERLAASAASYRTPGIDQRSFVIWDRANPFMACRLNDTWPHFSLFVAPKILDVRNQTYPGLAQTTPTMCSLFQNDIDHRRSVGFILSGKFNF